MDAHRLRAHGHSPPPGHPVTSQRLARGIGQRLRHARHSNGWSLQEAGRALDVAESVLGAYERATRAVSAVRLLDLAEAYDVDAAWLLTGEGDAPTLPAQVCPGCGAEVSRASTGRRRVYCSQTCYWDTRRGGV